MSSVKELRALRTNAGISQNALAKAIGRSHTYVWNVEAGRVKLTARETIEVWAESNTDRGMTRAHRYGTEPRDRSPFVASDRCPRCRSQ